MFFRSSVVLLFHSFLVLTVAKYLILIKETLQF